jgi:hypothetical protein
MLGIAGKTYDSPKEPIDRMGNVSGRFGNKTEFHTIFCDSKIDMHGELPVQAHQLNL